MNLEHDVEGSRPFRHPRLLRSQAYLEPEVSFNDDRPEFTARDGFVIKKIAVFIILLNLRHFIQI